MHKLSIFVFPVVLNSHKQIQIHTEVEYNLEYELFWIWKLRNSYFLYAISIPLCWHFKWNRDIEHSNIRNLTTTSNLQRSFVLLWASPQKYCDDNVPVACGLKQESAICCFKGRELILRDQIQILKSCSKLFILPCQLQCSLATSSLWPDKIIQPHSQSL